MSSEDEGNKKTKGKKNSKPRKRKKKQLPKDPLEFAESPIEGDIHAEPTIYPGSPRKVPTIKVGHDTASNWVSPEQYSYNSIYPVRAAQRNTRSRSRTRLVKRTFVEEDDELMFDQSKTRNKKRGRLTPLREDNEPIPTCPSTPNIDFDITNISANTPSFYKENVHFIFKGKTPVTKEFSVLVEDTPLPK